ncbi:Serine/threonine-protein kinase smu1, partial [Bonamia ostreae]
YPFDPSNFYSTEEEKQLCRKNIADDICDEVYSVESSRLLTLLNQSLKWQQSIGVLPKGSKLDLLRNSSLSERTQREKVITKLDNEIKFGDGDTHAESAVFSPDGQLLATGTTDGFIEIWDFDTAKLNTDLKYQAADELMIHSDAVLCLCFSTDSEKLAVGTKDGQIKIFRVSDGECIHYFKEAHGAGVTSVKFSGDGSQVLSSSLDFTAKIHGVRSGKTLKVFRGHKSFVNDVHFANSNNILTASSDGTMKLWSIKDSSCVHTINSGDKESAIVSICPFPRKNDLFFVCSRSPSVHLIRSNGSVLKSYAAPPRNGVEACFVAIATSSLGKYLYCVDEKNILYCFLVETGKLLHAVKTHEKGVLGIRHHPHLNILASFSLDHSLRLWRPKK